MRVTFDETRIGNARQPRLTMKIIERRGTCVPHTGAQSTDELIHIIAETAFIGYTTFDAFGDKLTASALARGITIDSIALHRPETAHAAVFLEATSLIQHDFARRFVETCEHASQHDSTASRDDRLDNIAAEFDTTISDDRDSISLCDLGTFKDCRDLRHTRPRDHARRTDRARANAHLDCIGAGSYQGFRAFGCYHISSDDRQ